MKQREWMSKKIFLMAEIFAFGLLCAGGYCGYRFIEHDRAQNQQINSLKGEITYLKEQVRDDTEAREFASGVTDTGFDYLAIGNSITLHSITDYWWGEWGMAASEESLDYYHLVVSELEKEKGAINTIAYSSIVWEVQSHDRTEAYEILDRYLTNGIDLVTVQFGENCYDISTFGEDFESLIKHIGEVSSDAQIIVIDDFFGNADKHKMKKAVCEKMGIDFVDLSDLYGRDEYKAGMGTVVTGEDGEKHVIEHSGVAVHPGDKGMRVIADRIIEKIN